MPFDTSFLEASGYQFEQTLSAGPMGSFMCLDDRGKPVVMKRLEDDCLHRDQLHPAIKDRLARIRELPHPRVATLRGAERFGSDVCMVWNYEPGTRWDDFESSQGNEVAATETVVAADTCVVDNVIIQRARDLISAVEMLHSQGIVHGNLHAGNIIVSSAGEVWLTDVSPYLYTDPTADIDAVTALLDDAAANRTGLASLKTALDGFDPSCHGLRDLANALAGDDAAAVPAVDPGDRAARLLPLIGALLIASAAVVIAFIIRHRFQ
jgi:serine/threonine protein kinase